MTEMKGKVAIVTGGGSGLGEAIGKALAKRGVRVVLSDINLKGAERVAGEIGQAGGPRAPCSRTPHGPRIPREWFATQSTRTALCTSP